MNNKMGIGDWGLGLGIGGWGFWAKPQTPKPKTKTPKPQTPKNIFYKIRSIIY